MVERGRGADGVITGALRPPASLRLLAAGPFVPGATIALDDDGAQHLRVRRALAGTAVTLLDGAGAVAAGRLAALDKRGGRVVIEDVQHADPLPAVHLLVPIADRERVLWLAEKGTELGLTSWRAVRWRRSLSVHPRGEGPAFQAKIRARMRSAVEQSANPWLPTLLPDANVAEAAERGAGSRYLLTAGAPVMFAVRAPVTLALGPEGGIEEDEAGEFRAAGFIPASVGSHTLRFETAGLAALAIVRASLEGQP